MTSTSENETTWLQLSIDNCLVWPRGKGRLCASLRPSLLRCAMACCLTMLTVNPFAEIAFAVEDLKVDPTVLDAQRQRVATMKKAADATIAIFGLDGGGGGSGVIVTRDGYALTNYHVSSACGDHMRCGLNDGKMYDAVIVGVDAVGDLSLIKLLGRDDFPIAPLADSNQVRVGQWCFAAGNPFVLASNLQPTISLGIVSGVNRYQYPAGTLLEYADCIQTDAAINPGNSGGPLFNLAGEVIGINGRCSFEKRGRINVGVGYAISANQCRYFMGVLRSGRLIDHATLGATVSTDDVGKILVSNILPSSDAYRRGLRYGDEIVSLADREVRTTNMFKNILGTLPREWRVPMTIRRDGANQTMLVRLEGVHSAKELIELVAPEKKPSELQPRKSEDGKQGGDAQEPAAPDGKPAGQDASDDLPEELRDVAPNLELVSTLLESQKGFANYHFNAANRDRLWEQLQELGKFDATDSTWEITGKLSGESTPVELVIGPDESSIKVGSRTITVSGSDDISSTVAKRNESGILVALRAFSQLHRQGPQKIGSTTYLGQLPVYETLDFKLNSQPRMDTLETLWYDATVRFAIADPIAGDDTARDATATSRIALVEVFGDTANDPVEVYLSEYKSMPSNRTRDSDSSAQNVLFPSRIRLQYGTKPSLLIDVTSIRLVGEPEQETIEDAASEAPE